MKNLSTAFLIIALAIVVNQASGVLAEHDIKVDQVAEETKNRAVTIIDGPKYVAQPKPNPPPINIDVQTPKPELRPPSKPPINPDKPAKQKYYVDIPRPYYSHIQKIPPRHYSKPPLKLHRSPNSIYKFPRVIPLPHHKNHYYVKESRPLVYAASNGRPFIVKSPKFSLPVQTINGIPTDFVRPPKFINFTTTTTTDATTTARVLRTKRIWPKRVFGKKKSTSHNATVANDITNVITDDTDTSASFYKIKYVYTNGTASTTLPPSTTRGYRPVTRIPKIKSTTKLSPANFTQIGPNDWVPIMPSHYPKLLRPNPTPISKRSDAYTHSEATSKKRMMYLQSFGLVPVNSQSPPTMERKKMVFFKRKRQLNPSYSGYSPKLVRSPVPYVIGDIQSEGSRNHPRVVTKIKHHHHHHHHRYIKTVEKPVKVPYRVEVPKPYPVTVEKKVPVPVEKIKVVDRPVPYPVTVEKKVPYPIGIRVPHPVPVKVVEKEYVPKPYPVIHHVPIVKQVEVKVPHPVPVPVEKKVPYPVEVKVPYPVDRPVPVQVTVEKRVPYPVPVKVLVPQPYPVETKVPYPVEVKVREPYEVIKHVPVRVPYPQPYAVKVPHPVQVTVEKKVPYPVEVEKKVPVPVEVYVPQRVEVEKKVPVYVPKPYPVEKRVPVPVKVPYPVKVPVKVPVRVPVEVPIYIHHAYQVYRDTENHYDSDSASTVTDTPQHTVTVHGNTGFNGFQSRSDKSDTVTPSPSSKS